MMRRVSAFLTSLLVLSMQKCSAFQTQNLPFLMTTRQISASATEIKHRANIKYCSTAANDSESLREHPIIELQVFLKLTGLAGTGGQVKVLIQGGEVMVNGVVETRRSKKLHASDIVSFEGDLWNVGDEVSAWGYVMKNKKKK